jgi:hypothetical protein
MVVNILHAEEAAISTRGNLSFRCQQFQEGRSCDYLQPKSGRSTTRLKSPLKMKGFWQRVLEGEKYVTGSLVPGAIYTIPQSFLQVIASQATKQVVKQSTRILLNDFD